MNLCSSLSRTYHVYGQMLAGIMVILLVALVGCSSGVAPAPTPTPAPPASLEFVNFDLGLPAQALNAPVVGTVPDNSPMHVVITFKVNQSTLNQLKSQKVKPGQPVNLQDQANKIGISDATYQQIKTYLGIENVTLKLDNLHTSLAIDGKASSFARIFQTHFVIHQLNGRTFFAPATPPKVPTFIASSIAAITGLDNYSQPPQGHVAFMNSSLASHHLGSHDAADCVDDPRVVAPAQVAHAYGYDRLWKQGWQGQGMTVNLVELEGFDPHDVQNYFTCVQFHGQLKTVNVDTPPKPTGGEGESTLDIETVAGLAPASNIVVYQTAFDPENETWNDFWTSFNDELAQIVNDNAKTNNPSVVSISWGYAEDALTPGVIQAMGTNLRLLTQAEHMTVFVASGDCGAFDEGVYKTLAVDYPGTDPSSTAVGGTLLSVNAQGNRSNEAVWSDGSDTSKCQNQWGSGGGISKMFKQPDWPNVNGMKNQYSTGYRQVPDLSSVAWNLPAYIGGQWIFDGGTSAAAPIWAAGLSLVNQGLIERHQVFYYGTDTFYQVAQVSTNGDKHPFYDVTKGNNLYYPATPGYDLATGLGTPNLADFFDVLDANTQ
jgi:kumamolisin